MYPLLVTSILGLAFIIERGLALRWNKVIPRRLEEAAEAGLELPKLKQICEEEPSTLSRLLLVAQEHLNRPREENMDAVQTQARREVLNLERGLVVLEIVVGIAPLLGLVGAIHGLITLFADFSASGAADNAQFARGISEALNTTLTGLIIAIPSLIAWSYYNKKVETLTVEMEMVCDKFLLRQYRERRG